MPKYLKDKIKFSLSFSILKKVLLRDNVITKEDIRKLTKLLIKENNLNKN